MNHGRHNLPRLGQAIWLLVLFAVLVRPSLAADRQGTGDDPAVVSAIDSILSEAALKGGFQGVVVRSLTSGRVFYERNADLLFMPASNQKLLTTAAVLTKLGPDWCFTTTLCRTGSIDDDGVLHGDLVLKGSGDPLLDSKDLDLLAESVCAAGIKRVRGRVIGDDSRFEKKRLGLGWEWDDLAYYYAPEVGGLNLNKNMITVSVEPGRKEGDPLKVGVSPLRKWSNVTVLGRTSKKGATPSLSVIRGLGTNDLIVDGSLPVAEKSNRRQTGVTVVDAPLYAVTCLLDRLKAKGIDVSRGASTGVSPASGTVEIARHAGEPLSEVLKKMNKPSDNLIAECLFKTLGAEMSKNGVGSWASGAAAATDCLKNLGVDVNGVKMEDGSGLSRHNFVSPRSYAQMLQAMHSHPYAKVFKSSLPVPGVDGTLKDRPIGPNAQKSCRAKTGTVSNVNSLSGYVTTKSGDPLLFVIFMNNHQCPAAVARGVQDRIVEFLASLE